jgi:hypothetical protein
MHGQLFDRIERTLTRISAGETEARTRANADQARHRDRADTQSELRRFGCKIMWTRGLNPGGRSLRVAGMCIVVELHLQAAGVV